MVVLGTIGLNVKISKDEHFGLGRKGDGERDASCWTTILRKKMSWYIPVISDYTFLLTFQSQIFGRLTCMCSTCIARRIIECPCFLDKVHVIYVNIPQDFC